MPIDPGQMMRFRPVLCLVILEFFRNLLDTMQYDDENEVSDTACRLLAAEVSSLLVERVTPIRITNYLERVIPSQTAKQFQEHFRMTPGVFEIVLRHIGQKLRSVNKKAPITKLMDPRRQLLAVLWLLATPDSYRSVGERFNMGKSSLHKSFVNVVKVLNSISKNIIKWPRGEEEKNSSDFFRCASIPGVIGAIDGCYIPIKAPNQYPERYINRKCYHAITVQAVCDCNLFFTDVFAGYPSSVSDLRIFRNSDLRMNILRGNLVIPDNYYIIGDKAYPTLKWFLTPYIERRALNAGQKKYNTAIAKTRQCIERAFALLKGRFRRLKYLDMSRTDLIPGVILACCVLHNLCLHKDDASVTAQYILDGLLNVHGEANNSDISVADNDYEGVALRERIREYLELL